MLPLYSLFPPDLLARGRLCTRILASTARVGRVTVLFRHHGSGPLGETVVPNAAAKDRIDLVKGWNGFYGLTYILAGRGTALNIDRPGDRQPVEAGCLIRFTRYTRQLEVMRGEPGMIECSVCTDLETGDALVEDGTWDPNWTFAQIGDSTVVAKAYLSLLEAVVEHSTTQAGLRWRLIQLIDQADLARAATRPDAEFTTQAKRLFEEHLEPSFSVADAADHFGCTPANFRRRFLAEVGITPARWQLRRRMERATELLHQHPVKQVAEILGYTDPSVFSRQYHRLMGLWPRDLA